MYYKLDDNYNPVQCSFEEAYSDNSLAKKQIKITIKKEFCLSTVFLFSDHGEEDGKPILFETIILGGYFNHFSFRSATKDEALIVHKAVEEMIEYFQFRSQENPTINDLIEAVNFFKLKKEN